MMGGDIYVKSKIGVGTCMIIAFPSKTCPEVPALVNSPSAGPFTKDINGTLA